MRNDSRATIRETAVGQIDLPTLPRIARLIEGKPWNGNSSLIGHCSIAFQRGWDVHRALIFSYCGVRSADQQSLFSLSKR